MRTTLTKAQEMLLDTEGAKLRETMQSEGWGVMARLFKETVEGWDSTQGLTTLKQVYGRQDAIRMMNSWMEAIVQRVERLRGREEIRQTIKQRISQSGMVVVPDEEQDEAS